MEQHGKRRTIIAVAASPELAGFLPDATTAGFETRPVVRYPTRAYQSGRVPLKRFNREVARDIDVVGISPDQALIRPAGVALYRS